VRLAHVHHPCGPPCDRSRWKSASGSHRPARAVAVPRQGAATGGAGPGHEARDHRGGPRRCAPPRHRSGSVTSVATVFTSAQSPRVPRSSTADIFCQRLGSGEGGRNCAAEPKLRGHDRHVAIREPFAHLPRVSSRRTPSARAADGRVPARYGIIKRSNLWPKSFLLLFRGSTSKSSAKLLHVRFDLLFAKVECPTALVVRVCKGRSV